jgi:hypothetical protein
MENFSVLKDLLLLRRMQPCMSATTLNFNLHLCRDVRGKREKKLSITSFVERSRLSLCALPSRHFLMFYYVSLTYPYVHVSLCTFCLSKDSRESKIHFQSVNVKSIDLFVSSQTGHAIRPKIEGQPRIKRGENLNHCNFRR